MTIDREIAEKVMGWIMSTGSVDPESDLVWVDANKNEIAYLCSDWSPSTNIQHAMEVEAEMCRKGYRINIQHFDPDGSWIVFFAKYTSNLDEARWEHISESLPEAICLAALAALSAIQEK